MAPGCRVCILAVILSSHVHVHVSMLVHVPARAVISRAMHVCSLIVVHTFLPPCWAQLVAFAASMAHLQLTGFLFMSSAKH
jgi:hypothetical protein